MRLSVCFHPAGLLTPLPDARPGLLIRDPTPFEAGSPFRAGPAPRAVPFVLVGPAGCLAAAAQVATWTMRRLPPMAGHLPPARLSSAQAAPGRSRPRLPLAVTVRALTRRRGLSTRPHHTSPFGRGAATLLRTLNGYHRGNVPPNPRGLGSHLPAMTPGTDTPEGRTPRAARSLRGRLGLLGWTTPCGVTAVRGPGYCLSIRVTPDLS